MGIVAVQTPVSTHLRYYPLFVLGDVSPRFDLLQAVRQSFDVADGDGDGPGAGGATSDGGGTGGAGSPDAPGDGENVEEWPP